MPIDVTPESFETAVRDASRERAVLVDFWAPWCQPCLTVAPALEELEAESGGRLSVAKVNVEEYPELGARYAVASIPALKLFVDGQVVAESLGALTKLQLQGWLEAFVPGEERDHLNAGRAAFERGDLDTARAELERALELRPILPEASVVLARVLIRQGDADRAADLLAEAEGADASRGRLELLTGESPVLEEARAAAAGGGSDALLRLGAIEALAGHHERALEALLDVVRQAPSPADSAGHHALLDVLELLGPDSDLAREYRRRLAALLF